MDLLGLATFLTLLLDGKLTRTNYTERGLYLHSYAVDPENTYSYDYGYINQSSEAYRDFKTSNFSGYFVAVSMPCTCL